MRTLGNILWHIPFLGFLSAGLTYLIGLLLVATVIAAPIGLGLMEFGKFLLAPFDHAMIDRSKIDTTQGNKAWTAYSSIVKLLYLPFGLILAVLSAFQAALLCITIIGIPLAVIVAKSLGTYLNPVNKKCVHHTIKDEANRRSADTALSS